MSIEQTLSERESRYGDFADHAKIAQAIQDDMRIGPGWLRLDDVKRQALTVIADKIARILSGDPNYADNWHDIQGYAKLVEDRLPADMPTPDQQNAVEPASQIDDESTRQQLIQQGGEMAEEVYAAIDAAKKEDADGWIESDESIPCGGEVIVEYRTRNGEVGKPCRAIEPIWTKWGISEDITHYRIAQPLALAIIINIGDNHRPETTGAIPMPIIENLPDTEYFAIEAASNSGLKKVLQSPAHFKCPEPSKEDSRAKQMGSAIHMALLEPDRYSSVYHVAEADDRVSHFYKGLAKELGADVVLTRPEARRVAGMQKAAYSNSRFAAYMKSYGRNELSVTSKDPVTGVPVKCRFDRKGDSMFAFDLKKCQDARGNEFGRAIGNYGYYMQVPFYAAVWEWETGEKMNLSRDFPLVAIEENSPHGCILHDLDEIALELGRRHFRKALDTYARCMDSGIWPAYFEQQGDLLVPTESELTSVPYWMARELTDDEAFEGV